MTTSGQTVCVHGLGYVGLPTAAMLANSEYSVLGFDADTERRAELASGNVNFDEEDLKRFVERALADGLAIVEDLQPADFHLICVPTPFDREQNRTDLGYVEAAGNAIADVLRDGDTVVLESTVPPGTTTGQLRPILERSGRSASRDFTLAFSPETVLPGNTLSELRENDRIVGGVETTMVPDVVALYRTFVTGDIRTTDATTAEFVKLIQNAYRDVNIAFANEVARLAHEFGINSRGAIKLANEHPRVDILDPGPGVGGHCIPIDPLFLNYGNDIPLLIETARAVNDGMVGFIVELLSAALEPLDGSTIGLLGVAYKGGVADTRESPSLRLEDRLLEAGVSDVRLTDPYVEPESTAFDVLPLEDAIEGTDAVVLVTDHPEYGALSPEAFANNMSGRVVVDTRAILDIDRWEWDGFDVYQV